MKKYLTLSLSFTFVAVVTFGLFVKKNDAVQTAAPESQIISIREAMNRDRLSTLLAADGIAVTEKLTPELVESSREILLRWDVPLQGDSIGAALSEREIPGRVLSVANSKTLEQGLLLQRAFELSTTQVLVVAVNDQKELRWWSLMPDPRVLRAETSDDQGQLSNRTLYRSKAQFTVAVPDDQTITEVRLYHPSWNGQEFGLESVGAVRLP